MLYFQFTTYDVHGSVITGNLRSVDSLFSAIQFATNRVTDPNLAQFKPKRCEARAVNSSRMGPVITIEIDCEYWDNV